MTTPTGTISLYDVAVELGISASNINLNQADVRALAGIPSGAISLNDLRGKSSLAAYINEATFSGVATDFGGGATAYSGYATLTVTGGSGGTTYAWACSGGATIENPSAATTRLMYTGAGGTGVSGSIWCVVTKGSTVTTESKSYIMTISSDGV